MARLPLVHTTYMLLAIETTLDVREAGVRGGEAVFDATVVGAPEVTKYILPTDVGENALRAFMEGQHDDLT